MGRKKWTYTKSKNPYWKVFKDMQSQLKKANNALAKDLHRKNINWAKVHEDSSKIMLLLGECSYLAKECKRLKRKGKWG